MPVNSSANRPSSCLAAAWTAVSFRAACSGPSTFSKIARLSQPTSLGQPARALGHGEQQSDKGDRGEGLQPEHPAPAHARVPGFVTQAPDDLVDEEREEDAGDDPELKERAQPSAQLFWCDLGDVNRADDRRRSDPQPAQKPRGEELLEDPG